MATWQENFQRYMHIGMKCPVCEEHKNATVDMINRGQYTWTCRYPNKDPGVTAAYWRTAHWAEDYIRGYFTDRVVTGVFDTKTENEWGEVSP